MARQPTLRFGLIGPKRRPKNTGLLLLIACSAKKRPTTRPIPAKSLYLGGMFRLALRLAESWGLHPLILSAKYGFISVDRGIPHYNQKFSKPYDGPYPDGSGYFIGGGLYFGNAPTRFKRIVPKGLPIGKQLAFLKRAIIEGPE